ncbi:S-adenosylmethionine synthase 1 [Glycine soja]|uniref:methionine adenosyltransferase n=1 Tax=Glycine soja TaxID=3848 RepID=A0A445LHZ8_GLYSO|nr:hypothetical protein JHK87_054769 [Glycine soja]KAG5078786.1 hypothetical protein JHK86_002851 [Glycine max]RZC22834.1 S-adenosylmethionine synthase 1 [Glycine soja]
MATETFLFTSESVNEGHPDKLCDPDSKVACETCTKTNMIMVFGEITTEANEHVIKPVIPEKYLDDKTIFHLNPSGRFVIGGPHGDAGLTGRKIIIDTYCGWGAHGGGAFSGKDPTKQVDLHAGALFKFLMPLVFLSLCQFGTGKIPDKEILQLVKKNFDFRPGMITINLDLKRGGHRFLKTAAYGHFGREDPDFTWEVVKPLKWDKPQA